MRLEHLLSGELRKKLRVVEEENQVETEVPLVLSCGCLSDIRKRKKEAGTASPPRRDRRPGRQARNGTVSPIAQLVRAPH